MSRLFSDCLPACLVGWLVWFGVGWLVWGFVGGLSLGGEVAGGWWLVGWLVCLTSPPELYLADPRLSPSLPPGLRPLRSLGWDPTTGLWLPLLHYRWEGGSRWTA